MLNSSGGTGERDLTVADDGETAGPHLGRPMDKFDMAAIVAVSITVAILGIIRIGDTSFWLDESFSARLIDQPLPGLLKDLSVEAGMGPYFLLLWAWSHLGTGEFWLRLLSVVGGTATVCMTFVVARRWVSANRALVCTVVLVCNPTFLRYLTELRAYSWEMFLCLIVVWLACAAHDDQHSARPAALGMASGMALALNILMAPVILLALVHSKLLVKDRVSQIRLISPLLIILLPFLQAYVITDQLDWIPNVTIERIGREGRIFLGGGYWATLLLIGCLLLIGVNRSKTTPGRGSPLLLVVLPASMFLSLGVLSLVRSVFVARYLSPVLPLLVIAAVVGYLRTVDSFARSNIGFERSRTLAVGLFLIVCSIIGFPGSLDRDVQRSEDLRSAARILRTKFETGDGLLYSSLWLKNGLSYYLRHSELQSLGLLSPSSPAEIPRRVDRALEASCVLWIVWRVEESAIERDLVVANLRNEGAALQSFEVIGLSIDRIQHCSPSTELAKHG